MKRHRSGACWAAALVVLVWLWQSSVLADSQAEKAQAAAKIVKQALQQEARHKTADRAALLRSALELAPTNREALWQSGFVFDPLTGEWLRFDEVAQFCGGDDRLKSYRKVRTGYPHTVEGQMELARWCADHKLTSQARAHLARVLQMDPDHPEARRQLGYRMVNGVWMTEAEIAETKARAIQASADVRTWRPKLEKLREGCLHPSVQRRESAFEELAAIRDPSAVGAIEVVFCAQGGNAALLGVELLGNIPSTGAAGALAWQAVFSPWEPVRQAAVKALAAREKHDYVPLLMSAMQSPVQSRVLVYEGTRAQAMYGLLYRHVFYREGTEFRELAVLDDAFQHVFVRGPRATDEVTNRDRQIAMAQDLQERRAAVALARQEAAAKAAEREVAVAQFNAAAAALNARISWALGQATGELHPCTPEEWQKWWYEYNEVASFGDLPLRTFYRCENGIRISQSELSQTFHSCFAAGTPVWTESGPVPIQEVRVGDRVFACDPETGCLELKPVLATTINANAETLKIQAGEETADCTGGHVFWVAGKGWVKARDLQPGMPLHTMEGTVEVRSVEPAPEQPTYNLIVADFHTYYAGAGRILTHDISIRQPTDRIVPGLAATAP